MLMPDEAIKSDEPFQMPVGFESDVHLCAGETVLVFQGRINRSVSGRMKVGDRTASSLQWTRP